MFINLGKKQVKSRTGRIGGARNTAAAANAKQRQSERQRAFVKGCNGTTGGPTLTYDTLTSFSFSASVPPCAAHCLWVARNAAIAPTTVTSGFKTNDGVHQELLIAAAGSHLATKEASQKVKNNSTKRGQRDKEEYRQAIKAPLKNGGSSKVNRPGPSVLRHSCGGRSAEQANR